jgi:hypothetical protein
VLAQEMRQLTMKAVPNDAENAVAYRSAHVDQERIRKNRTATWYEAGQADSGTQIIQVDHRTHFMTAV